MTRQSDLLRILVVCLSNKARSPMFEALLQRELDEIGVKALVESASLINSSNGAPADPEAIQVMANRNLDISEHEAQHIGRHTDPTVFHLIFVMDQKTGDQLHRLTDYPQEQIIILSGDGDGIPDPWIPDPEMRTPEENIAAYEKAASVLEEEAKFTAAPICQSLSQSQG